jgi:hypothetical protein
MGSLRDPIYVQAMISIPTAKQLLVMNHNITRNELGKMIEVVNRMISRNSRSEYVEDWTQNMINFMKEKGYKFTNIVDSGRYTYCHIYIDIT